MILLGEEVQYYLYDFFSSSSSFFSKVWILVVFPPRHGLAVQREPQRARQTAPLGGAGPQYQTS